jgi:glycosyltransferase involved in cell wall biosynthesis
MKMRVAFVTGSLPPDPCGVGDFTQKLAEALRSLGVEVNFVYGCDWSLSAVKSAKQRIAETSPDLVHIQYPTRGFGRKFGPHALAVGMQSVVTLHEFSQVHPLRSMSAMAFFLRSRMIFTTEYERDFAQMWVPWISRRSSVIPIASNIGRYQGSPQSRSGVAYFGLLRQHRGLEEFVECAELLLQKGVTFPIRIIGAEVPEEMEYFASLRESARALPIEWHTNQSEPEVARLLSASEFAYLHFPEGVTERRTSMIAAIMNGCAVLSNSGNQTPQRLLDAIELAPTPEAAAEAIRKLQIDKNAYTRLMVRATSYIQQFEIEHVAAAHLALYSDLLSKRREK